MIEMGESQSAHVVHVVEGCVASVLLWRLEQDENVSNVGLRPERNGMVSTGCLDEENNVRYMIKDLLWFFRCESWKRNQ